MTRKQAIELIKLATAEGDDKTAMRIYLENRISHRVYMDAMQAGLDLKTKLAGRALSGVTYADL
ncbi:MAG: hypothetical protein ThorAB25_23570 [Candidatus Thorarchaeota archaeon AB_25]|nr:MAG: hypothetical protein ThorAB25_23570 [Candidatus Thorarchaeota archaeon AB_25]